MFETLTTLFRARTAEAEEALAERNAVSLLAQHLRDARAELSRSRGAVAGMMAREAERGRAIDRLAAEAARREAEARTALEAGEEALAGDLADAALDLEDRRVAEADALKALADRIADARSRLDAAEARYRDLADQLRVAREAKLSRTPPGAAPTASALEKAVEAAERLQTRDDRLDDIEAAYRRLDGESPETSLDARVKAAGLDREREARKAALMNRLKAKGD